MMTPKPKEQLITLDEAAKRISCTRRHVHVLISLGELERVKIGSRRVRIKESSVEKFIQRGGVRE